MTSTHHKTLVFGKHRGERFTRVPISYLKFMVCNQTEQCEIAQAELERRGITEMPELEISGHAIDSASYRLIRQWKANRKKIGRTNCEGLHSWLMRIAGEALKDTVVDKEGRYLHPAGVILVFELNTEWPVLKTVYKATVGDVGKFN